MASSITLYDDDGQPVVLDGQAMKRMLIEQSRTWQDVTAERVVGQTYQNNTGGDIVVSVTPNDTTSGFSFQLRVNGETIQKTSMAQAQTSAVPLIVTIPEGAAYSAYSGDVARNFQIWMEYR